MYFRNDKWKKYIGRKTYGAGLSGEGKTEKFGDWDRSDTKTGHIRAGSFLALVASSYPIDT